VVLCYKWSIDDVAANIAVRAERVLLNPSLQSIDNATRQSQILYGSRTQMAPWRP